MMDSGRINKIQKAMQYAEERDERIRFLSFTVQIQGDNSHHTLSFANARWACDCEYFRRHGDCSHTMTMERVLGKMLPEAILA